MCDALKQMQEESMRRGLQKGVQQGIQKGMQQGMQQGVQKVAAKLLRMNHPIPFIAEVTDLSEAEIKKIKESMQP